MPSMPCLRIPPVTLKLTTQRTLPASVRQLTFVDFLEALTRLAIAIPIPSDEDMREVKVPLHASAVVKSS